jgi:EmrB/QacA subfamily drug resistance transporter
MIAGASGIGRSAGHACCPRAPTSSALLKARDRNSFGCAHLSRGLSVPGLKCERSLWRRPALLHPVPMRPPVQAASEDATAEAAPQPGAAHPRLVLTTTILASSLAFVDGSVVNVGLPAIGRGLSADADALQWVVNAYLLPLSAVLLLGGAAGDRYGRRLMLIAGTVLFALASAVCAVAPTLGFLLAGRLAQGIGAAMLMPNSLAILGATFSGEAKGRAIGVWAAAGAAMGAVGPVLGGWLIDLIDWRAIFLINLPLALGAILLASRSVPPDVPQGSEPLDWVGGVLATLGLGSLTWALTVGSGRDGWTTTAIGLGLASVVLLGLFVAVEARRGARAMLPLTLFRSPSFVGLTLLTLSLYAALGALLVLMPFVLIEALGYSATAAGAALLPLPLVLSLVSPLMGGIAGRIGSRLPLTVGSLIVGIGFLLAIRIDAASSYWTSVLPSILVIAVGLSGAVAPLTTAVLNSVEPRDTGLASGFNSAVARTGGLVATALLGTALAAQGASLVSSFHAAMVASAAACAVAAASAWALVNERRHS